MLNIDTLFDDENKDELAKLEAESGEILGRLDKDNLGKVGSGITNAGMPKYESSFGANSLFFNGGDGGYVTFVNFKKLIPFLIDHKGTILPYYYRWYESHASVSISLFTPSVPPIIQHDDEKSEEDNVEEEDPLTKKIRNTLKDIVSSTEQRVDEEYIGKDGKPIFLDGKLNVKEGFIKVSKDAIGFKFILDAAKRSIHFIDYFYFVDEKTGIKTKEWAIQIEAFNYEYYLALSQLEGLALPEDAKVDIIEKFTKALGNAKDAPGTMAWLYFKIPDFVFLQRGKNLLIDDLAAILQGDVNQDAVHTEASVIKILKAFVEGKKEEQDNLLYQLTNREIDKRTLLEILYDKMNDALGDDNFTAAIILLYRIWIVSSYADEDKLPYSGQPEILAYQSKKILGFYNSGFDFSFEKGKIRVDREEEKYIGARLTFQKIFFTSYDFFQPIAYTNQGYYVDLCKSIILRSDDPTVRNKAKEKKIGDLTDKIITADAMIIHL